MIGFDFLAAARAVLFATRTLLKRATPSHDASHMTTQLQPNSDLETRSSSSLSVEELREALKALNMDTTGNKETLKKRLRKKRKTMKAAEAENIQSNDAKNAIGEGQLVEGPKKDDIGPSFTEEELKRFEAHTVKRATLPNPHSHEYFLCFDVEATCEPNGGFDYDNEIIEFPAVLLCARTWETVAEFHSFVKPTMKPALSQFCKELTGIAQESVDAAPPFTVVLKRFEAWLRHFDSSEHFSKTAFITDGPWDLRDFISKQCRFSSIKRPKYMHKWVDLRTLFAEHKKTARLNLEGMLKVLEMEFEGRPHSGIDDARNVARIAKRLAEDGVIFGTNGEVVSSKKSTKRRR